VPGKIVQVVEREVMGVNVDAHAGLLRVRDGVLG
jgi:hypothetical protein